MKLKKDQTKLRCGRGAMGQGDAIYGLGVLGAAVYFIQQAQGFWAGVLGIIKALFWPAVLLHRVLETLKL